MLPSFSVLVDGVQMKLFPPFDRMLADSDVRNINAHTEMFVDAYVDLFDAGKLTGNKPVDKGKAIGMFWLTSTMIFFALLITPHISATCGPRLKLPWLSIGATSLAEEYQKKLITADEAAAMVHNNTRIHYGTGCGVVNDIDEALARRADELKGIEVLSTVALRKDCQIIINP